MVSHKVRSRSVIISAQTFSISASVGINLIEEGRQQKLPGTARGVPRRHRGLHLQGYAAAESPWLAIGPDAVARLKQLLAPMTAALSAVPAVGNPIGLPRAA